MLTDNTTYAFCIESLRYIHKMLGYDAIIQELNFINRIHNPHTSKTVMNPIDAMLGLDDMTEYDSESVKDITENKNIIIENHSQKYTRVQVPDSARCETILPTGKRCTFKRAHNSTNCTRHTK
jgi:hypothetical protein